MKSKMKKLALVQKAFCKASDTLDEAVLSFARDCHDVAKELLIKEGINPLQYYYADFIYFRAGIHTPSWKIEEQSLCLCSRVSAADTEKLQAAVNKIATKFYKKTGIRIRVL